MADVLGPIFETAGKPAEDGRKHRQGMDEIAAAEEITAELARMHDSLPRSQAKAKAEANMDLADGMVEELIAEEKGPTRAGAGCRIRAI